MSRELTFSVTQKQADFLALDCMFPAFIGGVGAGKSHCMSISGFIDASHSSNALVVFYEPTHDHIRHIILPKIEELLINNGIVYNYNKQEHVIYTSSSQFGDFIFRSLDNPTLIVGYEAYRSHIDELDVLPEEKAREAWVKIIARNRQRPKDLEHVKNRVSAYSTPEGFKFMYKTWEVNEHPEYKMVKAATRENPYLDEAYIQSLVDSYPTALVDAYLEGEFVNLNSTTVYNCYDRTLNNSSEEIRNGEPLFIGCDFNVGETAATVYVKRGKEWHAVAELSKKLDVTTLAEAIKDRWPNHPITMYPDSSGTQRSNVNSSISAIATLEQAGFGIRAKRKNPDIRDRVLAMNKALQTNKVFINYNNCPVTARCLEQQSYDKKGDPDKRSGHDHQNDATTYPIAYEFAVRKQLFTLDFSFVT